MLVGLTHFLETAMIGSEEISRHPKVQGLAALVILIFVPALALGAQEAIAAPRVHTIVMDKMKFGPVPSGLRVGDTIVWINKDMFRHTAIAGDKSFNIDLAPGAEGKTVLRKAGSFPFTCIFHPGMKGVLTVAR